MGLVREKQTQAESNSSRRRWCFSLPKVCKVEHNENLSSLSYPKKATSQEAFKATFESIQNTSGSNLFNERKKINPKTKSYSGGGEGKEVAPKVSMTTVPLTPAAAVAWGSLHQWDLVGQQMRVHPSAPFSWWERAPGDQTTELWAGWVRTMRIWVLKRGHLLVGRAEQDRMGSCREKGVGWHQSSPDCLHLA